MVKAFLSHSSSQKPFVEKVASGIGRNFGVVDKFDFESGRDLLSEIQNAIGASSLFVLFISDAALESRWVKNELQIVRDLHDEGKVEVTAFIIDPVVTIDDTRIKPWLKKIIIDRVTNPVMVARLIERKIREMVWARDSSVDLKKRVFSGRVQELDILQRRFYEQLGHQPKAVLISGLEHIGRKKLLVEFYNQKVDNGFHKTYEPILLSLGKDDQLDEFVFQLSEFTESHSKEDAFQALQSREQGRDLAIQMLNEIAESKEVVMINDEMSVIQTDGRLSEWFEDIISAPGLFNRLYFLVASRCALNNGYRYPNHNILSLKLNPLPRQDMITLFNRYASGKDIVCPKSDIEKYVDLSSGYPDKVFSIVDSIACDGKAITDSRLDEIASIFDTGFSELLNVFNKEKGLVDFCVLLAHFEYVSHELLYQLVTPEEVKNSLLFLERYSLFESFGASKQYIRLNPAFSDYISRNRLYLPKKFIERLQDITERLIKSTDDEVLDLSEQLIRIKNLLKRSSYDVHEKYLLPSYVLKVIVEQYNEGHYSSLVSIADRVLNDFGRHNYKSVIDAVKYWQCLALCRMNSPRALQEAEFFVTGDRKMYGMFYFIKGFYFRLLGKYPQAKNEYEKVLADERNLHARYLFKAEHELVITLMKLNNYKDAYQHSLNCYQRDSQNPYNVDAYFRCYVREPHPDKEVLKGLIRQIKEMSWNYSWQNTDVVVGTYEAEYDYYVNHDPMNAIASLKQIIENCSGRVLHYPVGVLKEICQRQQLMDIYRAFKQEIKFEDSVDVGYVMEDDVPVS